ncbi:MAG: type II toxin-antitoxin system VapC family toxin [Candidatus Micrarchaeota archaeon]
MFIDSNIFMNAISLQAREGARCRDFMKKIAKGEQNSTTSVLVLDEVIWLILKNSSTENAIATWERIISTPNLKILPIDQAVARLVPAFLKQGLDPRDAVHAATMKAHGIETILSYDRHFDSIKGITRQTP